MHFSEIVHLRYHKSTFKPIGVRASGRGYRGYIVSDPRIRGNLRGPGDKKIINL